MQEFCSGALKLNKSVQKGDEENLLSLFNADNRFEPMEILVEAEEDTPVKVKIEGLAETELKLGADMDKGAKKTIMTLFWFAERSKNMMMQRAAEAGETLNLKIML